VKGTRDLWFTGISGAGKTTIANALSQVLSSKDLTSKIIDGDVVRAEQHAHLGFTPGDIRENNRLVAELCVKHCGLYDYILVPIISPFKQSREQAKVIIGEGFREIYVKISLKEAIRRDTKGLYKKALNGEINNFIGIDPNVPYEEPINPYLLLDSEHETLAECIERISDCLDLDRKLIKNTDR